MFHLAVLLVLQIIKSRIEIKGNNAEVTCEFKNKTNIHIKSRYSAASHFFL
jgi:hypothetical protein